MGKFGHTLLGLMSWAFYVPLTLVFMLLTLGNAGAGSFHHEPWYVFIAFFSITLIAQITGIIILWASPHSNGSWSEKNKHKLIYAPFISALLQGLLIFILIMLLGFYEGLRSIK